VYDERLKGGPGSVVIEVFCLVLLSVSAVRLSRVQAAAEQPACV
jgi:hypothetical protein